MTETERALEAMRAGTRLRRLRKPGVSGTGVDLVELVGVELRRREVAADLEADKARGDAPRPGRRMGQPAR